MPVTRSKSTSQDITSLSTQSLPKRGRYRSTPAPRAIPSSSRPLASEVTPTEPIPQEQSSQSYSLQVLAARRDVSPFDDREDAAVFERYRKELEEEIAAEQRYEKRTFSRWKGRKRERSDPTAEVALESGCEFGLGPRPWFLDDPGRPQWGTAWTFARRPPLQSILDLSFLPPQSPADRVPVGHQLTDWQRPPSIPFLPYGTSLPESATSLVRPPAPVRTTAAVSEASRSFIIESIYPSQALQQLQDIATGRVTDADAGVDAGWSKESESLVQGVQSSPVRSPTERLKKVLAEVGKKSGFSQLVGRMGWLDEGMDEVREWDWEESERMRKLARGLEGRAVAGESPAVAASFPALSRAVQPTATWSEGITSVNYPRVDTQDSDAAASEPPVDTRGRALAPVPRPPTSFVLPPLSAQPSGAVGGTKSTRQSARSKTGKYQVAKKKAAMTQSHPCGEASDAAHARVSDLRKVAKMKAQLSPFHLPNTSSGEGQPPIGQEPKGSPTPSGRPLDTSVDISLHPPNLSELEEQDVELQDALADGTPSFGAPPAHSTVPPSRVVAADEADELAIAEAGGIAQQTSTGTQANACDGRGVVEPTLADEEALRRRDARKRLREDTRYSTVLELFSERRIPVPPLDTTPSAAQGRNLVRTTYPRAKARPLPAPPHPLHPDFPELERRRKRTRVFWIVPLHGDVYVPGLEADYQPSNAEFVLTSSDGVHGPLESTTGQNLINRRRQDPRHFIWSSPSIALLWTMLKKLQRLQRFGPISLSICSTSPDPFRPRPALLPATHKHGGASSTATADAQLCPRRPEVGAHVRVYCDLEWARWIRNALASFKFSTEKGSDAPSQVMRADDGAVAGPVTGPVAGSSHPPTDRTDPSICLFQKKRLVLVGDMGEALIVI